MWSIPRFSKGVWYCEPRYTTIKVKLLWCQRHSSWLFKYYLTNRKQCTIINGVSSSILSITHGANRISLNVNKTEIILFRPKIKIISKNMNFHIVVKKITPTTHTRYSGFLMDQHLSWDQHLKMLKQNFSRANGLLAKVRYYLSPKLFRTFYYSIFESHLRYGCQN